MAAIEGAQEQRDARSGRQRPAPAPTDHPMDDIPTDMATGLPTDIQTDPPTDPLPDAPAGTGWTLGRRFMLRVAGLPIEAVHPLHCPDSRHWARRVLDEEERLRAAGAELSDLLHGLVRGHDDEASRRALLRLRRELFNNRLPRDVAAARALVADLAQAAPASAQAAPASDPAASASGPATPGGGPAARLDAWLTDRGRLERIRAEGGPLLAADIARSRAALRRLAGTDRLRRGLLLASPTLDGQLDGYLADTSARPAKRLRKIERSLLSYVYRAACKTSPFSTLTGVALGRFEAAPAPATTPCGTPDTTAPHPAGAADRFPLRLSDAEWTSHVRLNVVVLARLADLILADPDRRGDLPVALAPGWGLEDDRVRYVQRSVTAGDDAAAVTFETVSDRLFFLRRSGVLERLIGLFAQRGPLRHRDLVDWLATEERADPAQCRAYLAALADLGMIRVPVLATHAHTPDPLRALRDTLRAVDRPWAAELAAGLAGPIALLDRYPAAAVAERRELLRELRGRLHALQEGLGDATATLPQTLLYEDADANPAAPPTAGGGPGEGAADGEVVCDADAWERLYGQSLRDAERLLPAFDLTLAQRLTFKGFFVARYGRGGTCEDLLRLVHDFHEDFFDQYLLFTGKRTAYDARGDYVPEENWLGLAQITALDEARRTFTARMRALWEQHGGAAEIRLDEDFVADVAAHTAPITPDFTPYSHFLQLARAGDEPLAVLNRSYGNLSFPFSRFTHVHQRPGTEPLAERLRRAARAAQPTGAVLAEITGGPVTSNLNLHGRMTDYEIVCPGESGAVPEEFRLHLADLTLSHDAAADRLVLRSRRLGKEVIPVYLGYLVPMALPETSRTLLLLSPSSMALVDPWAGVPAGPAVDGVVRRPRVRLGALVLGRRSWTTTAADLPARAPGDSDEEWFLRWQRWQRRHGVPDRVYATVQEAGRPAGGAKPAYVDLGGYLSLTALDAQLRGGADTRVVFREALPDQDALHVSSARGRHVAELAVETLGGRPRPPHRGTPPQED